MFLRRIWNNTDPITKWIQVVALGVAAYWTYTRFLRLESPSLETRADIDVNLDSWEAPIPHTCYITMNVGIQNSGLASFEVGKVRVRAWHGDLPKPGTDIPTFMDVDKIEESTPIVDFSPYSHALQTHYSSSQNVRQTIVWTLGSQRRQIYVFRADVEDRRGKPLGYASRWKDDICNGGDEQRLPRAVKEHAGK